MGIFKNFTYCTILFLALFLTWKNALCALRRQKSTLSRNLRRYFCIYLCTPKTCEISMYFFTAQCLKITFFAYKIQILTHGGFGKQNTICFSLKSKKKLCSSGGVIYQFCLVSRQIFLNIHTYYTYLSSMYTTKSHDQQSEKVCTTQV